MFNVVLPFGNIQSEGCATAQQLKAACLRVSLDEHLPCAASLIALSRRSVNRPVVKVLALRRSVTVKRPEGELCFSKSLRGFYQQRGFGKIQSGNIPVM